jgi:hypothetical protein
MNTIEVRKQYDVFAGGYRYVVYFNDEQVSSHKFKFVAIWKAKRTTSNPPINDSVLIFSKTI